jgi:hypothetical protein
MLYLIEATTIMNGILRQLRFVLALPPSGARDCMGWEATGGSARGKGRGSPLLALSAAGGRGPPATVVRRLNLVDAWRLANIIF